jgi:hypothetical protein
VHDDTPQAKLDKLDAVLTQTSTQEAALFAEMLSAAERRILEDVVEDHVERKHFAGLHMIPHLPAQ